MLSKLCQLSLEKIKPGKEFDSIGYFLLLHNHFHIKQKQCYITSYFKKCFFEKNMLSKLCQLSLEKIKPGKEFDSIGYFLLLHNHFHITI